METAKSTQKTVTIDQELWSALADWLESEKAKRLGYHSKAQFCTEAVRELLEYHRQNKPSEQRLFEELLIMNGRLDEIYEISRKLPYKVHRLLVGNEGELKDDLKIKTAKAWTQKSKKAKLEKLLEKTNG